MFFQLAEHPYYSHGKTWCGYSTIATVECLGGALPGVAVVLLLLIRRHGRTISPRDTFSPSHSDRHAHRNARKWVTENMYTKVQLFHKDFHFSWCVRVCGGKSARTRGLRICRVVVVRGVSCRQRRRRSKESTRRSTHDKVCCWRESSLVGLFGNRRG